jgi:hypothetical protein
LLIRRSLARFLVFAGDAAGLLGPLLRPRLPALVFFGVAVVPASVSRAEPSAMAMPAATFIPCFLMILVTTFCTFFCVFFLTSFMAAPLNAI